MLLSINLNKIALLRNSRGSDYPNLQNFAFQALEAGAQGITLHPRPDHRHATSDDIMTLSKLVMDYGAEFNVEGNPFEESVDDYIGFNELIKATNPTQATLVPDKLNQITSDHGWTSGEHDKKLKETITELKNYTSRVSIFIDPDINSINYAKSLNVDSVELYTEEYAKLYMKDRNKAVKLLNIYKDIIIKAKSMDLRVNAGHDLNLENLPPLRALDLIDEVSIGHAVIVDSLKYGFIDTIKRYVNIAKG
mgnify:FL=1